jgi:hypothetical protein
VLHDLEIPELTISHILRHSTKSSKSVAGRHYIKPSMERMRAALEKVEKQYLATTRRGGARPPLSTSQFFDGDAGHE